MYREYSNLCALHKVPMDFLKHNADFTANFKLTNTLWFIINLK